MLKKIVLDLETQKSFRDVGGRGNNHLLKISVCGIYDYSTDQYQIFEERQLPVLAEILEAADQIIGFNIFGFDFEVLRPYLNFDIFTVPYLDLMLEIEKALGHRLSLETVARATLGAGKSGSGLDAILYWQRGQMEPLKKYCLDDVRVTCQLYEYALKNQKLLFEEFAQVKNIPMRITEPQKRFGVMSQAALF